MKPTDTFSYSQFPIIACIGFHSVDSICMLQAIMEAAELKKSSRIQKVVVTGCLAQRYSTELAGENHYGCKETNVVRIVDNPPRLGFPAHADSAWLAIAIALLCI